MKAIVVQKDGRLHWSDVPDPVCGSREVIVKIHATAVNRADLLQRRGMYLPPAGATDILGLECAGEIVATGVEHGSWQVGDRVCALLPGGGYAQFVNVPSRMLLPIPDNFSYEEAAALPEVFSTAYINLFSEGRLKKGEKCLIHAGASGVGTAAIQLARQAGADVYTTVGHSDKIALCEDLGARTVINYREADFFPVLVDLTKKRGVDVILDMVGSTHLPKNLQLIRYRGRIVVIGLLGGTRSEIDLSLILIKNVSLIGSTLRNRSLAEKIRLTDRLARRVWPLLNEGIVKPVIDSVDSILDIEAIHRRMEANESMGKLVLQIPHDVYQLPDSTT